MDDERAWAVKGWVKAAGIVEEEFGPHEPAELAAALWGEDEFSGPPINPPDWLRSAVGAELPGIIARSNGR